MKFTSQQKDTLETAILDYANNHDDRDYDYRLHMACRKFRVKFYGCVAGSLRSLATALLQFHLLLLGKYY